MTQGEAVIVIDADLKDSPEVILEILNWVIKNGKVVPESKCTTVENKPFGSYAG